MNLCKWTTNSPEIREILRGEFEFSDEPSNLGIDDTFQHSDKKALGIRWNPNTDEFSFNADHIIDELYPYATDSLKVLFYFFPRFPSLG